MTNLEPDQRATRPGTGESAFLGARTATPQAEPALAFPADRFLFIEGERYRLAYRASLLGEAQAAEVRDEAQLAAEEKDLYRQAQRASFCFGEDLEAKAEFIDFIRGAQHDARLIAMQHQVAHWGESAGWAQGRRLDPAHVTAVHERFERYLVTQGDILRVYPSFEEKLRNHAQRAESSGIQDWFDAEKRAIAISLAMTPFFPDLHAITDRLLQISPREVAFTREAFFQRYDKPLDIAIEEKCGKRFGIRLGSDEIRLSLIRNLLGDDHAGVVVDLLALSRQPVIGWRFTPLSRALELYHDVDMNEVCSRFDARYGAKLGPAREIPSDFDGFKAEYLREMLSGNRDAAELVKLHHQSGHPVRYFDDLYDHLAQKSPTEMAALGGRFEGRYGTKLVHRLSTPHRSPLWPFHRSAPSEECACLRALVEEDRPRLRAGLVALGFKTEYTPDLMVMFQGKSRSERAMLLDDYRSVFGRELLDDAAVRLRRRNGDLVLLQSLVATGRASEAVRIFAAVDGIGTDENLLRKVLRGKTSAEIERISKEFGDLTERVYGRREILYSRIKQETSGDSWFDLRHMLRGSTGEPRALAARLLEVHSHERAGARVRKFDKMTKEGVVLDRDLEAMLRFVANEGAGLDSATARQRFGVLSRFVMRSAHTYRLVKNEIANKIAHWVTPYAATLSIALLEYANGGHVSLLKLAATSLAVGTVVFPSVKRILKGQSYGREEAFGDILVSVVDVGCRSAARKFSAAAFRYVMNGTRFGAKFGVKRAVRAVQTGEDPRRLPQYLHTSRDLDRALIGEPGEEGT